MGEWELNWVGVVDRWGLLGVYGLFYLLKKKTRKKVICFFFVVLLEVGGMGWGWGVGLGV